MKESSARSLNKENQRPSAVLSSYASMIHRQERDLTKKLSLFNQNKQQLLQFEACSVPSQRHSQGDSDLNSQRNSQHSMPTQITRQAQVPPILENSYRTPQLVSENVSLPPQTMRTAADWVFPSNRQQISIEHSNHSYPMPASSPKRKPTTRSTPH